MYSRMVSLRDISLISSTVPDGEYLGESVSEYVLGAAYSKGDLVYHSDHYVYAAINDIASLDNDTPPPDSSLWRLIGALDRWAMFVPIINKQTIAADSIEVVVDASRTDYVGLFGVDAVEAYFELFVSDAVVASETISLIRPISSSGWYQWFYDEYHTVGKLSWEYPKYAAAQLKIVLTGYAGGSAACGFCGCGSVRVLGKAQINMGASLVDYSYAPFVNGLVTITPGSSADDLTIPFILPVESVGKLREALAREAGRPTIFDIRDSRDADLFVLALFKRFERQYSLRGFARCSLQLNGLI